MALGKAFGDVRLRKEHGDVVQPYRIGFAQRILWHFAGQPIRTEDVLRVFGGTKANCGMQLFKMYRRGQLTRLQRGVYQEVVK